jgi:hypothetical protein
MRARHPFRRLAGVAFLALVCVSAALLEESFVHTDDGCAVEIHCEACRLLAGTAAVIGPPLVLPAVVPTSVPVVAAVRAKPRQTARCDSPSRAPPLSA